MRLAARLMMLLALVTFVAGGITVTAAAASMDAKMLSATAENGDMGACSDCGDDGSAAPACSEGCVFSHVALSEAGKLDDWRRPVTDAPPLAERFSSQPAAPDPLPPRPSILN